MTIETYRDAWGIPDLRADDARELARAQGRVTAHDRARQLEMERHRAQGTSASFRGAEAVARDVFARRARLADTARRCFGTLERRDPDVRTRRRSPASGARASSSDPPSYSPRSTSPMSTCPKSALNWLFSPGR